jgi:hypothetical protein
MSACDREGKGLGYINPFFLADSFFLIFTASVCFTKMTSMQSYGGCAWEPWNSKHLQGMVMCGVASPPLLSFFFPRSFFPPQHTTLFFYTQKMPMNDSWLLCLGIVELNIAAFRIDVRGSLLLCYATIFLLKTTSAVIYGVSPFSPGESVEPKKGNIDVSWLVILSSRMNKEK